MKNDKEDIQELIDAYLMGDMSTEEATLFTSRINSDPELANQVEATRHFISLTQQITSGRVTKEHLELQARNEETIRRLFSEQHQTGKSVVMQRALITAAAVILICIAGYLLMVKPFRNQRIYSHYFSPFEKSMSLSSTDSLFVSHFLELYQNKNYKGFIESFDPSAMLDTTTTAEGRELITDLSLYLGISYMETGDHERAAEVLTSIDTGSQYYYDAQWYYCLCLVKSNQTDSILPILNMLVIDSTGYDSVARSLGNEIK
ncbi:MAG TPA: hypothetical protein PLL28_07770 [Chitinophagales bacterium]|nr:hypothetical protein [Saprospiraceae bacterium]HNE47119.1 hypothetical protein [Chitinophagales bacterium]HNF69260.1 hypothetical protein [Chitinophagales bacterium]HNN11570.1 hypothetical protein [Bacteroidia bacterium]HNO29234.1 hypothetical protein [Chitinophagales bacterium]